MTPSERIAVELMGWVKRGAGYQDISTGYFLMSLGVDDFSPFTNPAHATLVLDRLSQIVEGFTILITIRRGNYWVDLFEGESESPLFYQSHKVWTEPAMNAVLAYLDSKEPTV